MQGVVRDALKNSFGLNNNCVPLCQKKVLWTRPVQDLSHELTRVIFSIVDTLQCMLMTRWFVHTV